MNINPIHVTLQKGITLPSIQQYPLKLQAISSIDKLIRGLQEQGILVKCQSICNTPILAVPKPGKEGQYRLVQDLREINSVVEPLHAPVPNPTYILAQIPAAAKVFSIVDVTCIIFSSSL